MPMALTPNELKLFGLDLGKIWAGLFFPLHQLIQLPGLRWLRPVVPVLLKRHDGSLQWWTSVNDSLRPATADQLSGAAFQAIELPTDLCLIRRVHLPQLHDAEMKAAIALEAQGISPFPSADLVWGFRRLPSSDGRCLAELALASRRQVEQFLDGLNLAPQARSSVEVWVLPGEGSVLNPIQLRAYGGDARDRSMRRGLWLRVGLLGFLLITGICAAITPSVQLWFRANSARDQFQAIQARAGSALNQREKLVAETGRINELADLLRERVEPLRVMELLTQALPDDTVLSNLQVQGTKVSFFGQTANAAALMQKLSGEPLFKDVKAPSPAVKPLGAIKENFSIEFTLDTKAMRANDPPPVMPVVAVVPPASSAQAASAANVSTAPVSAPASASASVPASAPVPAVTAQPGVPASPAAPVAPASAASNPPTAPQAAAPVQPTAPPPAPPPVAAAPPPPARPPAPATPELFTIGGGAR